MLGNVIRIISNGMIVDCIYGCNDREMVIMQTFGIEIDTLMDDCCTTDLVDMLMVFQPSIG